MFTVPNPKILLLVVLGLTLTGCSNEADPDSPEGQRQATFKQFLQHSEPMGGMLRGRLEFDGEAFAGHARALAESADAPWALFPEPGESRQKTAALPKVWSDPQGFAQAIDRYQQAVADLAAVTAAGVTSPEQVDTSFTAVQQSCKGCHDNYRR